MQFYFLNYFFTKRNIAFLCSYYINKSKLYQNYPNPFNPSKSISFNLNQRDQVRIDIFNVLGQHVQTLLNEIRDSGKHSIEWHAGDLSSGVYIYRLVSNTIIISKPMMLIK